ncbi:carbamoyltransferase [Neisseria meningitidis 992008]|nr:putative carbamoyltransferase [Neisseria meningitidis NM045]KER40441.1 carbamoyltransferase [Neisseria meningitidis 992008]
MLLLSDCRGGLLKERSSETVFVVSDDLWAQTLRTACVRSAHILLVEFRFHMGYGLLISDDLFNLVGFSTQPTHLI